MRKKRYQLWEVRSITDIKNKKVLFFDRVDHWQEDQPVLFFALLYAVLCWISLSAMDVRMPVIVRLMVCAICFLGGQKRKEVTNYHKRHTTDISMKVILFLVYLHTVLAFGGIYLLDPISEFKTFHGTKFEFFIITLSWCRVFSRTIIWAIGTYAPKKRSIGQYWKVFLILFILGIGISCIWLYAFNPAITSTDSQGLYMQAMEVGTPGFTMRDWQPPMYVFIIAGLQKIWDDITFMVILQMIFFWLVMVDAILYFYKMGVPKWILWLAYLYMAFGYSDQIQLVTFWKDIPFGTALVWLTLLLAKVIVEPGSYAKKWYFYVGLSIALLFVAFLRQNGILAVGALIILLPLFFRNRGYIIVSAWMLMTLVIVKGPIYRANNIIPQPSLKYFAMTNDLLKLYFEGYDLDDETIGFCERVVDAEAYRENVTYSTYWNDYFHADLSDVTVSGFVRLYIRNLIKHPKAIIRAFLERTQIIWSITKNDAEITSCIHYVGEMNTIGPELYPHRISNFMTDILTNMVLFLKQNNTIYIFFWRPGIYNLFIILSTMVLLINLKKRNMVVLLPVIPIVLNVFALFVSSGWPDYRYHWPSVLVSWIIVSYVLLLNEETILKTLEI